MRYVDPFDLACVTYAWYACPCVERACARVCFQDIEAKILERMVQSVRDHGAGHVSVFQGMVRELSKVPKNIEELADLRAYMAALPSQLNKLAPDLRAFHASFDVLAACRVVLLKDDMKLQWDVFGFPRVVLERMQATDTSLQVMKSKCV